MKPEKVFVYLGLFFGLLFVFIVPPFQNADEIIHYNESVRFSKFALNPSYEKATHSFDYKIDEIFSEYLRNHEHLGVIQNTQNQYSYQQLIHTNASFTNKIISIPASSIPQVHVLNYVPQGIGMFVGDLLSGFFGKQNVSIYFYMGRIFNLLFFLILCYAALKINPFKSLNYVFVFLLLSPMALFQASSLSYDVMTIAICVLFISYLLKIVYNYSDESLLNKDKYLILILGYALYSLKGGAYTPLLLMVFLIPNRLFTSLKNKVLWIGVFFILIFIISKIYTFFLIEASQIKGQSFVGSNFEYFIYHPANLIATIISSFKQWNGFYVCSFIGVLGWLDTSLFSVYYPIWLIGLFLLVLATNSLQKIKISLAHRLAFLIITIGGVVVIFLGLSNDPVQNPYKPAIINGVQGRYFIPLSFLLVTFTHFRIGLFSTKIYEKIKFYLHQTFIYALLLSVSLILTLFILILRYYIPAPKKIPQSFNLYENPEVVIDKLKIYEKKDLLANSEPTNDFFGAIDAIDSTKQITGYLKMSGWLLPDNPYSSHPVEMFIKNKKNIIVGYFIFGDRRLDVHGGMGRGEFSGYHGFVKEPFKNWGDYVYCILFNGEVKKVDKTKLDISH